MVPKNAERLEMEDINEQYLNEFLEALQTSINQMSADGIRISYVPSKSMELGKYMANVLDEQWKELRGMEIQSVGIASISYDETSQELINMRNKGAMMGDPSVREGYVQSTIAEGLKGAGTNSMVPWQDIWEWDLACRTAVRLWEPLPQPICSRCR